MATITGGRGLSAVLDNLVRQIENAGTLYVGFLETEKYPDGTPVAQVAYKNEFGEARVPSRPFFRQMIATKQSGWGVAFGRLAVANNYNFERVLALMGEGIKDQLTKSIIDFDTPPNAPLTVKLKGFNNPLIETGQMQRATGYEVRKE